MNRPWLVWIGFGSCLALLLAALAWLTSTTLRQERAQRLAEAQAALEEKVRLALWRMDSTLTPLIVQESSRPFFADSSQSKHAGKPSALTSLAEDSTNVLIHFQFDPAGHLSSPDLPPPDGPLPAGGNIALAAQRLDELRGIVTPERLLLSCASSLPPVGNVSTTVTEVSVGAAQTQQRILNQAELNARTLSYQQAIDNRMFEAKVAHGPVRPIWLSSALVLARRVQIQGSDYLQGCWLDWPSIERSMLDNIHDLLPAAKLQPIAVNAEDPQARRLAAIPVSLIPGPLPALSPAGSSPVRLALLIAWPCLFLAAIAVGLLLHGALSLSERRGAFVSAVTHELRTPLTTFRMYCEMLAEDMIQPEKRKQYLQTLNREAARLQHLVENVLAYARLERGSARRQIEQLTVDTLIDRLRPRLDERAAQAGLNVRFEAPPEVSAQTLQTDPGAVEQILFNLVDNACKYAAPASAESNLHLQASVTQCSLRLRLRDHGPGIRPEVARRLFRPFSKSDQEAAQTAPGIGLGLSLCRRLSRSLGGDLRLETNGERGASFLLELPLP